MGIVVLSFGDLAITLVCLRSTGMQEANPVASFLIRLTDSVSVLIAYKAATVAVCAGLLYRLRRQVEGEVAAWCSIVILAIMALQWHQYTANVESLTDVRLVQHGTATGQWLVLD